MYAWGRPRSSSQGIQKIGGKCTGLVECIMTTVDSGCTNGIYRNSGVKQKKNFASRKKLSKQHSALKRLKSRAIR